MFDQLDPFSAIQEALQRSGGGQPILDPSLAAAGATLGINMMQPRAWGDTAASQIGRAIGSAGEAAARGEAQDQKDRESEAKTQLMESRAAAAGARTGAEAQRLQHAAEALGLKQQNFEQTHSLRTAAELNRALAVYSKLSHENSQKMFTDPSTPPLPPFEEMLRTNNPTLAAHLGKGEMSSAAPAAPRGVIKWITRPDGKIVPEK